MATADIKKFTYQDYLNTPNDKRNEREGRRGEEKESLSRYFL